MYYTIYKVTNKLSGKFYIGSHKTTDLDDDYMGSGKYLKRSIDKHGLDNFEKEVLFVFDTPEEMYAKEAEIVDEDFLAEQNTYNLKVGGFGGWDYVNTASNLRTSGHDAKTFEKISDAIKQRHKEGIYKESFQRMLKTLHEEGRVPYDNFKGKTHTEETKQKIGAANAKHQTGTKNSQFGTMWITNEQENKKIKKTDSIPEGWRKGRKITNIGCLV